MSTGIATPRTSPGSSPSSFAAGPAMPCSTPTRPSAGRPPRVGKPPRQRAGGRSASEKREDGEHAPVVPLAVRQPELFEDGLHVPFDRARAEEDPGGDGAVGPALGDQRQDLALAR